MKNNEWSGFGKGHFEDAHNQFQMDCGCHVSPNFFQKLFDNATNDPTLNTFPELNIKEVFLKSKGKLSIASKNLYSSFNKVIEPIDGEAADIANQIEDYGYFELPSFFSKEWASQVKQELSSFDYFSPSDGKKYRLSELRQNESWSSQDLPSVFASNLVKPEISKDSKIYQLIENKLFSAIASSYFGSQAYLVSLVSFFTCPKRQDAFSDAELHNSAQKFHFDYSNLRFLKVFVYLTDMPTAEHGAHEFIIKSHADNFLYPEDSAGFYTPGLRRHPNGQLEGLVKDSWLQKRLSPDQVKTFIMPAGSVFIEDTSGLHRGGHCSVGHREMLSMVFAVSNGGAIEPGNQSTVDLRTDSAARAHLGCFDKSRKGLVLEAFKKSKTRPTIKRRIKNQLVSYKRLLFK